MPAPTFLLTGTPGTGKTTVAKILAKQLKAKHIELTEYVKSNNLSIEKDIERETFIVDIARLQDCIQRMVIGSETPLIIDGHLSQLLLDESMVTRIFILRKEPWVLKSELEKRSYSDEKVWENLEAEILGTITSETDQLYSDKIIHEIDTTHHTPQETVYQITENIKGNIPNRIGYIDWVSHPKTLTLLRERTCI